MKTLRNIALLAIATLIGFNSFASNDKVNGKISQVSENEISVQVVKAADEIAKIKVMSEAGSVLYHDKIKKHNRADLSLNLSQFPEGRYTVMIQSKNGTVIEKEVIKSNSSLAVL